MADNNWADKTIWTGDNLLVMRGMNSESVDPPFNSKANYAAPIGARRQARRSKTHGFSLTWMWNGSTCSKRNIRCCGGC